MLLYHLRPYYCDYFYQNPGSLGRYAYRGGYCAFSIQCGCWICCFDAGNIYNDRRVGACLSFKLI